MGFCVQVKFHLGWSLALTVVFVAAQIVVLAILGNGNYIVQARPVLMCLIPFSACQHHTLTHQHTIVGAQIVVLDILGNGNYIVLARYLR